VGGEAHLAGGRRSRRPGVGLGSDIKNDPGLGGRAAQHVEAYGAANLWFHGGNLMQSRHYSLYLALQLKAQYMNHK